MKKKNMNSLVDKIIETKPLIHNITNIVVANFTANGLLALGAKPVMASAPEEVNEITEISDALVLNLGTFNKVHLESMKIAGKAANNKGIPIVLDPVGVGASCFRTNSAQELLQYLHIQFIRGNAAEVANLIGHKWEIKGVETGNTDGDIVSLAILAAQKLKTTVIITGKNDIITDGNVVFQVQNGHPLLTKVTGAGCLLSAIVGAFAAVEKEPLEAAVSALVFYGVAAEMAAVKTAALGPGSFQIELINQLANLTGEQMDQYSLVLRREGDLSWVKQ